jgi:[acyl-carrier-protein] S-malonyltransferase
MTEQLNDMQSKTAWVFPGQGSQIVGMGADLFDLPQAQEKLQKAKEVLGWDVVEICRHEEDMVSRTLYTQPCLYVLESILADLMYEQGYKPDVVAGHSLGECSALYAARVFDYETGLQLVKRRAELMDSFSGGVMAALLGCDRTKLENQIAMTDGVVLANDNNDGQVVISGSEESVDAVIANVKCRRALKLNVSGAFHSPYMAEPAAEFEAFLANIEFQKAQVPVLCNVEPVPTTDPKELKKRLILQMTGSVRWRETSLRMAKEGIEKLIEVGPGKVLTGIIKRTCPGLTLYNVSSLAEFPA